MSEVKRILTITPERQKKEQFVFKGFKCPVCRGQKQFHNEVSRDKIESTDCTFCQGTGSLQCEVQLTWGPDENCT
jgi:hypothetical protein